MNSFSLYFLIAQAQTSNTTRTIELKSFVLLGYNDCELRSVENPVMFTKEVYILKGITQVTPQPLNDSFKHQGLNILLFLFSSFFSSLYFAMIIIKKLNHFKRKSQLSLCIPKQFRDTKPRAGTCNHTTFATYNKHQTSEKWALWNAGPGDIWPDILLFNTSLSRLQLLKQKTYAAFTSTAWLSTSTPATQSFNVLFSSYFSPGTRSCSSMSSVDVTCSHTCQPSASVCQRVSQSCHGPLSLHQQKYLSLKTAEVYHHAQFNQALLITLLSLSKSHTRVSNFSLYCTLLPD